jgi:hypothetical protein
MKTLIPEIAVVLLLGSTAYGGWYVGPTMVQSFYPGAPVYAYPAPAVVIGPRVVYSPIVPGPMLAPAPLWYGRPVVVGPAGRVYVPGRPVRNTLRAVLP